MDTLMDIFEIYENLEKIYSIKSYIFNTLVKPSANNISATLEY